MTTVLYVITLDCGHHQKRRGKPGEAAPREGEHAKCSTCHQLGTIVRVSRVSVTVGRMSVKIEEA